MSYSAHQMVLYLRTIQGDGIVLFMSKVTSQQHYGQLAGGGVGVPATNVQESWESQRFFIVLLFERMVMVLSLPRKIMVSWLGGW